MFRFARFMTEGFGILSLRLIFGDDATAEFFGEQADAETLLEFYDRHPAQTTALVTAFMTPNEGSQ